MNKELVGVILAAGKGTRVYPKSLYTSKVMFEVAGEPLLQKNIKLMKEQIGIRKIYIIVGHYADQITSRFGDGSSLGVNIVYIHNREIEKGIGHAISLVKGDIEGPFVVMLGDELYFDTNHSGLREAAAKDFNAIVCVKMTDNPRLIQKNYSVNVRGNLVEALVEKPDVVKNEILGCGTYVFTPKIFKYLDKLQPNRITGRMEMADLINLLIKEESDVHPFFIEGKYINVNDVEDLNSANYLVRNRNFDKYRISVIIPAYNEAHSIEYVVKDFMGKAHEVLVMDNLSFDGTAEIAKNAGAKVISEKLGGYGDALKKGMENASGDILVLVEADGSFKSKDLSRILDYMKDADMVIGTRTTRQLIEQGANMDQILRWGNVFVSKIIELLWWFEGEGPRLTDVGCTYRAIWRDVFEKIKDNLTNKGPAFSPEMMIEVIRAKKRIIEIPTSYYKRIGGESKFSKNKIHNVRTGLKMLSLILRKRIFG